MSTKTINRRNFLGTSFKGLAIAGISVASAGQLLSSCSSSKKVITSAGGMGFDQQPLPYGYDALEDVIDARTMEIHYSKHAAGYSKNLKEAAAAENVASGTTVENLLAQISKYSTKMRNNAGGHFNHELFWKAMRPKKSGNNPVGPLMSAIEKNFTSFENFKLQFANAASGQFGSGWAWLYVDGDKNLKIAGTPNQDNPLMDLSPVKGYPLLGIDVWEHAYYLKYQNKRADYIANWWNVVNWDFVQDRWNAMK